MNDLTAVSLFSGVGGIDRALELAGASVKAAVEIDPACRGVLARHFPETRLFEDVTEVSGDQLRAAGFVPGRGVLAAGWPCQGNSAAGSRGGMADPRSGLWRHVVRLLAETRPRWFLGENVPGLLSVNGGRDFGTVLRDLDELGYGVAWRVLDAQWLGVPQQRRRVFLVGCLGDGAGPAEVLLEPEGGERHLAAVRPAGPEAPGRSVVSTLQGGGRRGYRVDAEGAAGGHLIVASTLTAGSHAPGVSAPGRRNEDDSNLVCVTGRVTHTLTSEGADASEDGTGRGAPIVASGDGVRRLTPRERERLQGFPDDWTRWRLEDGRLVEQSDSARDRQTGNAVAVPVVEWITRRLVAASAALSETEAVA